MSNENQKPEGKDPRIVEVADSDMELNDQDLDKVAGGTRPRKTKTIDKIDTGHPVPDTD